MKNQSGRRRIWALLAASAAVLALLVLAWRLASGQSLWIILNGMMQGELR